MKTRTCHRPRGLYLLWLSLAVCIFMGCDYDDSSDTGGGSIVSVGDEVPAFMLTGDDGETVSAASLKGRLYLLTLFDTGCPDCRKELPVLQQIYEKYAGSVTVLNVPRSQTAGEVAAYWSKEGLTMPVYTPADKGLYYKFAASGIPRTYVVDEEGKVHAVFTDNPLADYATIDTLLRQLLG